MRHLAWGIAIATLAGSIGATQLVGAKEAERRRHHPTTIPPASATTSTRTGEQSIPLPTENPASHSPAGTPTDGIKPSAVVVDTQDAQAVLGKSVRSSAGEDMGRLIDVIVGRNGNPRAAIIDFGGFLGVGSRKIAVDWQALHFSPDDPKGNVITLELTRDQVKAAPEFKEGSPIIVLGALGSLQPMPFTKAQEK
jgi:PRC-barrel domain